MGANYAESVFNDWSHLPRHLQLVLVRMALYPHDFEPNPSYWNGWRVIAHVLGHEVHEHEPDGDKTAAEVERKCRRCRSSQEAARRAVAGLVDVGAVRVVRHGRVGRNAEYELNLKPVEKSNE